MPRTISYQLALDGREPADLRVEEVTATEGLGEAYRVAVRAVSHTPVDVDALLGKPSTLRILVDDAVRCFHGVLFEASIDALRADAFRIDVVIAPRLALLELGQSSRIFQELSIPDIARQVLEEGGIAAGEISLALSGAHPVRKYVVQRNESDLAFLGRLLAEEGITIAVHNDARADRLLLFDDSTALPPIAARPLLDRDLSAGRTDSVFDLRVTQRASSDAAMLRDYDFKRPAFDLSAREAHKASTGCEVYEHAGRITSEPEAKRVAKLALEHLIGERRTVVSGSDCPFVEAGRTLEVEAHPRRDLRGKYTVLRAVHRGHVRDEGLATYENRFDAVPVGTLWRPRRIGPPSPPGTEVAFVTGPSGQEQHAEEFGRVKVRFPWDRSGIQDDKSSTWLRVGQLPLGGSMILPRVGFEVLVDHELGDLDRPLVTGHLYNGEAAPPYALPGGATRSALQSATLGGAPGANELRFEDAAGDEEIFLHASKDLSLSVENDATFSVGNNETVSVGASHTLSVGTDHVAEVGANRTLSVVASQSTTVEGDYSEGIGGSETVGVGGMRKVQVGGDFTEKCDATMSRTVGMLQSVTGIGGYDREIVGNATTHVAAAWMELCGQSRGLSVGGVFTETVGGLKMIKAQQMSVSCGAAYAVTAGSENVKTGESRTDASRVALAISVGGGWSVKAQNITITAKNKLTVIGGSCTIELSSDGKVRIKAPKIELTGTRDLTQVKHESN